MKSELKRKTFGYAIIQVTAKKTVVFTFSRKADAINFQNTHPQLSECEIRPGYDRAVPKYGTESVIYEVHTRAGGGCGVYPARVNQWPHTTVEG